MQKQKASVKAFIFNSKGQLLLLWRGATAPTRPSTWDLPGGMVDDEEDLEVALRREVFEETGLKLAKVSNFFDTRKRVTKHIWHYFLCMSSNSDIKLSYEHDRYIWQSLNSFSFDDMPKPQIKAIKRGLKLKASSDF